MISQQCAYPRGKALGGSSVINYMIYTRGSKYDYNKWAEEVQNTDWNYENVLPYFKKSEKTLLDQYDRNFHGRDGLLSVSHSYSSELTDAFIESGSYLGYKQLDYNGESNLGFSRMQATLKNGRRHSVAKAFLETQSTRSNLDILLGVFVTKILTNTDNNGKHSATGVELINKGNRYKVGATKEVILSAGAFHSPKLLMLSGIGPRKHLKDLGINVVHDVPAIGENLQDHIGYIGLSFLINQTIEKAENVFDPEKIAIWFNQGTGPLTSLGGIEGVGYINTKRPLEEFTSGPSQENSLEVHINPPLNQQEEIQQANKSLNSERNDNPEDNPDVELIFAGGGILSTDNGIINRRLQRVSDEFYDQFFKPNEGKPGWTIFPMLLHPKSKGRILLQSTNPFDAPRFQPNYFSHPDDKKTLIDAIKFTIRLARTPAFRKYDTKLSQVPIPHCQKYLIEKTADLVQRQGPVNAPALAFNVNTNIEANNLSNSTTIENEDTDYYEDQDAYWNCALEYLTITLHHQVGTCRMASDDDPNGVVNGQLLVKGFNNLRIVDTSIIPNAMTAHTNAPAVMIGEKAADIIKQTYSKCV